MNTKVNCERCNKQVPKIEIANKLCSRCQDILEFGYQSFPSYKLAEYIDQENLVAGKLLQV
jgi:hypothetical protein